MSLGLLALGPMCVFLCSAVSEWRVCGLSFLGRDLRISLLAAATEPSGRQAGYGFCSAPHRLEGVAPTYT